MYRQSSLGAGPAGAPPWRAPPLGAPPFGAPPRPRPPAAPLAHVGLNSVAIFTPSHLAGGCAAFHRKSPTGGAAKGMPLNIRTLASWLDVPATDPELVLTGSGIAAKETAAIRVPRARRMRLRFIEMLLGNLINITSLAARTPYTRSEYRPGRAPHRIRSWSCRGYVNLTGSMFLSRRWRLCTSGR